LIIYRNLTRAFEPIELKQAPFGHLAGLARTGYAAGTHSKSCDADSEV
jgi:hypothetical protein